MDLSRKYMWIWVICGMIFVSMVICLIFVLINRCISKKGKHKITSSSLDKRTAFIVSSNKYQETTLKASNPPLPPRTQFGPEVGQSYENLAEVPDYEQSMPDYEQDKPDYVQGIPDTADYEEATPEYEQDKPDYVQDMPDYEDAIPEYEQDKPDYVQSIPDYEQDMPDYEEIIDEPPDYLKLEEEELILPPPPSYQDPQPEGDNDSSEDYDDIGGEDETQDEEDYDDVG
ncbi:uncharacterized protein LOC113168848 isoform X2 [Xyrichtys novacula]|uniref:Uncharacterized protein LOC113168848 isoform X2 n=1 Tax=Xyrichtys novacula TaxID=13765 RepID=A0AAV1FQI4_XYRNO|nr:uncharacterized protein LOC113168848 isoform X2 [Xyrichtys novacula]